MASKKIIVAVTGSIAAYKAAYLVRLLVQAGMEVRVVMTPSAREFITPLTLATLSGHAVYSDFTEDREKGEWTRHVDLALWADLLVVAPLSAATLARMASGACENFMMAVYMSLRCPVMVAPAMDHDMYLHPATADNLSKLKSFGHLILEPGVGRLASGLIGKGRMSEPDEIFNAISEFFSSDLPLKGKTAMVTAGPTFEPIDPVRYIGNHSTGTMGYALARVLAERGAQVYLVSGPVHVTIEHPSVHLIQVHTAAEMAEACIQRADNCDLVVLAAAVADYRPAHTELQKIKKSGQAMTLQLEPTTDIAATLGAAKKTNQVFVGFALETDDEEENARRKLVRKNLDMIVLNSLRDEGAGFGTDTNKITVFWPDNKKSSFGLKNKQLLAADLVDEMLKLMNA